MPIEKCHFLLRELGGGQRLKLFRDAAADTLEGDKLRRALDAAKTFAKVNDFRIQLVHSTYIQTWGTGDVNLHRPKGKAFKPGGEITLTPASILAMTKLAHGVSVAIQEQFLLGRG